MDKILQEKQDRVVRAIEKYADTVRRVCFVYLKNRDDVEDIFQDVFLQLYRYEKCFDSEDHEKAWLLRVAINKCKDLHKSFFKSRVCPLDELEITFEDETEHEIMHAVLALPQKYKDVIYLFYYEGYSVPEISKILGVKDNTIYSHLHRAKLMLREKLED
ncbi:RNA polymerase sigma-70 factor, ECF subfamily [Sporobacter termitidis DSM 10068]|uniref:RNA polymerase sigma-70 factor, ECF subfamily n=1 Tax=Sporobacter termitidis DSM 10068 TaxID=1123282 RepID=A0A1M5TE37_9FIRM|nr:sigma-70 family RNA polymerase sigma factor [Sporobacter termitidis]SHH49075.1 RNA polymerase sigma-70 factor, ECF subfamily [Sporobacter termitidis DSM 10068]